MSIHSAGEEQLVGAWMKAQTTSDYPWIGLSTQTCSRGCSGNWVAEYTWSDGTATDYRNPTWSQNDNAPTYGHYYRSGTWGTHVAAAKAEGICQTSVPLPLSPPPPPSLSLYGAGHCTGASQLYRSTAWELLAPGRCSHVENVRPIYSGAAARALTRARRQRSLSRLRRRLQGCSAHSP